MFRPSIYSTTKTPYTILSPVSLTATMVSVRRGKILRPYLYKAVIGLRVTLLMCQAKDRYTTAYAIGMPRKRFEDVSVWIPDWAETVTKTVR